MLNQHSQDNHEPEGPEGKKINNQTSVVIQETDRGQKKHSTVDDVSQSHFQTTYMEHVTFLTERKT